MIRLFKKIVLLILICTQQIMAYSYFDSMYTGGYIIANDSRSLGIGGTGIAFNYSPTSIINNPANIGMISKLSYQINAGINSSGEEIRICNKITPSSSGTTFSLVDINMNNQTYLNLESIGVVVPVVENFNVGLCYYRMLDFNYRNSTFKYQSPTEREGFYDFKQTGSLDSLSLASSFYLAKTLSLAIGYDMLFGNRKLNNRVYDYPDRTTLIQDQEESIEIKGYRINTGLNLGVTKRLNIACFYQTKANLAFTGDYGKDGGRIDYEMVHPQRYGVGMAYKAVLRYNTIFSVDLIFAPWRNDSTYEDKTVTSPEEVRLKDTSGYKYLNNVDEVRFGAEHQLYIKEKVLKFPIRYGMMWIPSAMDNRVELTMFTIGIGFHGSWLYDFYTKIDLGLGIGKRNYICQYGQEPYNPPFDEGLEIRVYEGIQHFLLSITFEY